MPKRLAFLDILRFIAIFLVLGRHGANAEGFSAWNRGGWVGVDLFFVLSGFLVGGLLFKELRSNGRIDYVRFLVRRGFKIYPAFFFCLLVTLGLQFYFGAAVPWKRVVASALFFSNYQHGLWGHHWSLGVEEHFYLVFPVLLIAGFPGLHKRRQVPHAIFASILLIFFVRILHGLFTVYADMTHTTPTHLRLDSLLIGVLVGYFWIFDRERVENFSRRYRVVLFTTGLLLLLPPFFWSLEGTEWMSTLGFTSNYVGAALVLCAGLTVNASSWFSRGLAFIGARSYSIYLWHAPILYWGIDYLRHIEPSLTPFAAMLIFFAAAIAGGVLLAEAIEIPFLKLRDRLT